MFIRLMKLGRKLTFKYREYAENFSKKIKKAIKELDSFPKGYEATGYVITMMIEQNGGQ